MSSQQLFETTSSARLGARAAKERGEVRTQRGVCPTHGTIEATKVVPKIRFPFIYYGVLRAVANAKPFRCPECGERRR